MAIVKVYRIQNVLTESGMYTTNPCDVDEYKNIDDSVKYHIRTLKNFLENHQSENQPAPVDDYQMTFKSCPFDDRSAENNNKPFKKFFDLRYDKSTKYGCKSLHQLFNQWLLGDFNILESIEIGMFQLLEVYLDEEDCLVLDNQIMYNSSKIIATEILDLYSFYNSLGYGVENVA